MAVNSQPQANEQLYWPKSIGTGRSHTHICKIKIERFDVTAKFLISSNSATNPALVASARPLGANEVWNQSEVDWEAEVKRVTDGKCVHVIVDFVGQDYFQKNLNSAARDGCIVIVGLLSGSKTMEGIDLSPFVKQRIRVEGSRLRSRDVEYQGKLRDMLVRDVLPKFVDGTLKVPVERVFDWNEIANAHLLMESITMMGMVVCRVL